MLKSLETARNEKLIGAPLEARVRLSANGDLYPLLEQYAGELPGLFIVSQVELERRGRRRARRQGGARGGQSSASAAGSTRTDVGSDAEFPDHLRGVRAAPSHEIMNG